MVLIPRINEDHNSLFGYVPNIVGKIDLPSPLSEYEAYTTKEIIVEPKTNLLIPIVLFGVVVALVMLAR